MVASLKSALNMKPEVAAKYLGDKSNLGSWHWNEVYEGEHAKIFTVAKVAQMDLLKDIKDEIQKSIDEGQTFETFKKNITPTLKNKGWWGKKEVENPKTGKLEEVQLGSPHRLETIYRTNLNTAYARGRYDALKRGAESHPYWMYVTALDDRTRPTHRALHGKVFRHDDPFWDYMYPPNDWLCRCRVRGLSEDKLKRKGLEVEKTSNNLTTRRVFVGGIGKRQAIYTDPKTKQRISPAYGWSYNVGGSSWTPDFAKYDDKPLSAGIKEIMNGLPFFKFYKDAQKIETSSALAHGSKDKLFPVGAVSEANRKLLQSKENVVFLSEETLVKNLQNHADLNVKDYRKLPDVIDKANIIVSEKDIFQLYIFQENALYYAVLKATKNQEIFLSSFRKTNTKSIKKKVQKGKIIKNDGKIDLKQ